MRKIMTLFLLLSFFCAKPQDKNVPDSLSAAFFKKKYTTQSYPAFNGNIVLLGNDMFKFGTEVFETYGLKPEFRIIFEKGLFYPQLFTQKNAFTERNPSISEGITNAAKNSDTPNHNLIITQFEELSFPDSPTIKRFRFRVYRMEAQLPEMYFIELANTTATAEMDLSTFVSGSMLTFFDYGWQVRE